VVRVWVGVGVRLVFTLTLNLNPFSIPFYNPNPNPSSNPNLNQDCSHVTAFWTSSILLGFVKMLSEDEKAQNKKAAEDKIAFEPINLDAQKVELLYQIILKTQLPFSQKEQSPSVIMINFFSHH
jgi:hypothetical protein